MFFLMKFLKILLNKTALNIAVENGDIELVQLLLTKDNIDVNIPNIIHHLLFNTVKNKQILIQLK